MSYYLSRIFMQPGVGAYAPERVHRKYEEIDVKAESCALASLVRAWHSWSLS